MRFKSRQNLPVMLIGEIAQRAAIRPSAVRYYERLGLLPAADRVNGRRRYTEATLHHLRVIRFARVAGFSLREIRELTAGRPYSKRMRELAKHKIEELDGTIERARTMQSLLRSALRCNCLSIEECGRKMRAR